jgi:hypothetical protein
MGSAAVASSYATYHVITRDRTYRYTDADLRQGRSRAYLLDDEPMAGPQRRLRRRIEALYARALALLTARNARGESWAHDFMGDDHTHVYYELLDEALENPEMVDLGEAIRMMDELLAAFEPGFRFEYYEVLEDRDVTRVYERNAGRRARMEAERDALRAELAECGHTLRR